MLIPSRSFCNRAFSPMSSSMARIYSSKHCMSKISIISKGEASISDRVESRKVEASDRHSQSTSNEWMKGNFTKPIYAIKASIMR